MLCSILNQLDNEGEILSSGKRTPTDTGWNTAVYLGPEKPVWQRLFSHTGKQDFLPARFMRVFVKYCSSISGQIHGVYGEPWTKMTGSGMIKQ